MTQQMLHRNESDLILCFHFSIKDMGRTAEKNKGTDTFRNLGIQKFKNFFELFQKYLHPIPGRALSIKERMTG